MGRSSRPYQFNFNANGPARGSSAAVGN